MSPPVDSGSCVPPCLTPKSFCGEVRQAAIIVAAGQQGQMSTFQSIQKTKVNNSSGSVLPPAGRDVHMRARLHGGVPAHRTAEPVCPHSHSGDPHMGRQER